MTISPQLMQAILSMDSYNRNYAEGIKLEGTTLGSATIFLDSQTLGILQDSNGAAILDENDQPIRRDVDMGFYAIAYSYGGSTVISYRGTDDMIVEWNNEAQEWQTSLDVNNGYNVGAGIADTPQSRMSFEFYRAVADALNNNNPADPYAANISVTGHSLGAGFAGLVGAIGGRSGAFAAL